VPADNSQIVIHLVLAAVELAAGVGIGWWLFGRARTARRAEELHTQRVLTALGRLEGLTSGMVGHVEQHVSSIEAIGRELTELRNTAGGAPAGTVVDAVARIVEVNDELTRQLASAKVKIQEQTQTIAAQAAVARTDFVTGLANQQVFEDELRRRLAQWQDQETPLSVMLIDVDQLQEVHASRGADAADKLLHQVAQTLCGATRAYDLVARYEDDQFAVMLPGTRLREARQVADGIRRTFVEKELNVEGVLLRITLCEGISEALPGDDARSLLKRTGKALAASTEAGGDSLHLHDGANCKPALLRGCAPPPDDRNVVELNVREYARQAQTQGVDPHNDTLTGLLNRRSFFETLRSRLAEREHNDSPLSLLLIDVDQLHKLNEAHGQLVGDMVLRAVTQVVRAGTRQHLDATARYEGGKLAAALVDTSLLDAVTVAERVRRAMGVCRLRAEGAELRVTLTAGVAEAQPGEDCVSLIKAAETALKSAKSAGRNATHYYDPRLRMPVAAVAVAAV